MNSSSTIHSNRAEARHPSRLKRHLKPRKWVYKPLHLQDIPQPSLLDWVRFYASVGTHWEFLHALTKWARAERARARRVPIGTRLLGY